MCLFTALSERLCHFRCPSVRHHVTRHHATSSQPTRLHQGAHALVGRLACFGRCSNQRWQQQTCARRVDNRHISGSARTAEDAAARGPPPPSTRVVTVWSWTKKVEVRRTAPTPSSSRRLGGTRSRQGGTAGEEAVSARALDTARVGRRPQNEGPIVISSQWTDRRL
jgi:hypothetical protein